MTALAQSYIQPLYEGAVSTKHRVIAASVTIYAGTLAMNDAGKIKVFTSAGYTGGATLLGFPTTNVVNSTASDVTLSASAPACFRRHTPMVVNGKAADLPTATNVGGPVYVKDNFTVGKTDAGSELAVTLLEVNADGTFTILLP